MYKILQTTLLLIAAMAAGYFGGLMSQSGRAAEAAGNEPAFSELVRTNRLEIVDKNGATRGIFGMSTKGFPGMAILDEKGEVKGFFDSSHMTIFNANGNAAAILGLSEDGAPNLILSDGDDNIRGLFALDPEGTPLLELTGDKSSILLFDDKINTRMQLGYLETENAQNPDKVTAYPLSTITLFDKDEKVTWQMSK